MRQRNKVVAIIQARSTSNRLPDKMLINIAGKRVIERLVDRIKAVNLLEKLIDEIVVATPKNDPIKFWCEDHDVKCHEGSEIDVLDRFYRAAKAYNATICFRICGDCPFIEPVMVWGLIKEYLRSKRDYMALGFNRGAIPGGWDAEIFTFKELERVWARSKNREHVTTDMRSEFEDFKDMGLPFNCKSIKLDLDTKQDLERLEAYAKLL